MKSKSNSGIYYDKNKNKYIVSYSIKNNETGEKRGQEEVLIQKKKQKIF